MRRTFAALSGFALSATLAVIGAQPARAAEVAYFSATDVSRQTFVIKITDQNRIREARRILSGAEQESTHVMGRIQKRPEPYNPGWSFVLTPESVTFFSVAIEVCDATVPYVEDHLDEVGGAFLPGAFWCPWTSRLTAEVEHP